MGRVRRRRWFIGGLAAEAILLAVELSTGGTVVITSGFVVPPLVIALYATPDETAIVGAAATIASVVAIAVRQWVDLEWVIPFLVVTLGAVIAWFTALARANAGRSTYELGLLAEVGEVADGRAGLEETIRRVTELAVPELASCCCIDAIAEDGSIRRIAANVASDTPNREAMEAALLRRRVAPVGSTEAARSGQPIVLESVAHTLPQLAADARDRRIFEQAGWGPGVFLPLHARGRRIGVVSLIRRAGEEFDPRTIRFTQVLAGRVGAALDNAGLSAELSGIERRLDAILDNLDEAVTVQDAVTGRTTYANEAAARLLQISPEELMTSDPGDIMDRYEVRAEDGSPIDLEALPAWRLRDGEDPGPMTVRNVVRATGEERWLVNRVTGVTDDAGRLALIVNVIEDVTETKRAERAQHLLAEIGLVAGHDEPEAMLRVVAEAFVPEWSETCALALVERDRVRPVLVNRGDACRVRRARGGGGRGAR